ncbi:MAG TPA: sigma-54 dependent transcriptional regulator [Verrucomicrobiae bacterium]|nr:sigma-54 dependent transcriptional regulator [Verrucomicrobiae bacterium]
MSQLGQAEARVLPMRAVATAQTPMPPLIGNSSSIKAAIALCDSVAQSDCTVVLTGETGTGKEVLAKYIHARSRRRTGAYVGLNCAAIPETLLESELFGHVKGAFTGSTDRPGIVSEANGGTLMLDEVGEMPTCMQVKLLRLLQERKFRRLGSNHELTADIRVIAATNRDLDAQVKEGTFRQDLYYRLNVINIALAPLRERRDDIPELANYFLGEFAQMHHSVASRFSDDVMSKLRIHSWPGNVRELRNVVERAVVMSTGVEITNVDLDAKRPIGLCGRYVNFPPNGVRVDEVEQDLIKLTLEYTGGNKTKAAAMLGISLKTLHNKLGRMGYKKSKESLGIPA